MTIGETTQAEGKTKISFLRSMQMVTWAFLRLRSRSAAKDDMSQTKPIAIVVEAIISAGQFIFSWIQLFTLFLS